MTRGHASLLQVGLDRAAKRLRKEVCWQGQQLHAQGGRHGLHAEPSLSHMHMHEQVQHCAGRGSPEVLSQAAEQACCGGSVCLVLLSEPSAQDAACTEQYCCTAASLQARQPTGIHRAQKQGAYTAEHSMAFSQTGQQGTG